MQVACARKFRVAARRPRSVIIPGLSHQAASGYPPPVPRLRIGLMQTRHSHAEARWDGLLAARPCPWGSPSGDAERPSEAVDPQQLCVPRRCTGAGWCVDSGRLTGPHAAVRTSTATPPSPLWRQSSASRRTGAPSRACSPMGLPGTAAVRFCGQLGGLPRQPPRNSRIRHSRGWLAPRCWRCTGCTGCTG